MNDFVQIPVKPTAALLRPFHSCPPEELESAWQAMCMVASKVAAPAAEPTIEWIDQWGTKHSMPLSTATEELKTLFDEWPCGMDEVDASLSSHKRLLAAAEERAVQDAARIAQLTLERDQANAQFEMGRRITAAALEERAEAFRARSE